MNKTNCKTLLPVLGCGLLLLLTVALLLGISMRLFLPILLALPVGILLRKIALPLSKKTRLPIWLWAILLTLLLFTGLGWLCYFVLEKLVAEGGVLLQRILESPDELFAGLERLPEKLFGSNHAHLAAIRDTLRSWLLSAAGKLSGELAGRIAGMAAKLPDGVLFTISLILGSYYVCVGYEKIRAGIGSLLPGSVQKTVKKCRERIYGYFGKLLLSTGILFLLTFAMLFFGFWIFRFDYPFTPALLIALLDMLPVLGVGAALIPMAVYRLLLGQHFVGIGLLILYAVISLTHQIVLPHLLGKGNGIPPLLTLAAMYAGYRLAGFLGLLLGPILALLAQTLLQLLHPASTPSAQTAPPSTPRKEA